MLPTDEKDIRQAIYHAGLQEYAHKCLDRVMAHPTGGTMLINGETYVPWDHFKVQLNLANRYREAVNIACTALHT